MTLVPSSLSKETFRVQVKRRGSLAAGHSSRHGKLIRSVPVAVRVREATRRGAWTRQESRRRTRSRSVAAGATRSRTTRGSSRRRCSRCAPTRGRRSTRSPPAAGSPASPSTGISARARTWWPPPSARLARRPTPTSATPCARRASCRAGPTSLSVVNVLNKVPPHLVGDQIIAEARRLDGVSSAALYLVDIDGSRMLLLAGSPEFPAPAAGPARRGTRAVARGCPGPAASGRGHPPRGDALPALPARPRHRRAGRARRGRGVARRARPAGGGGGGAGQALHRRPRHRAPAQGHQRGLGDPAEPPAAAHRAALGSHRRRQRPALYDVGGDWFDYVNNADGGWLGLADAIGMGPSAAALASIALGAFRAARRNGAGLAEAVGYMDECVTKVGGAEGP